MKVKADPGGKGVVSSLIILSRYWLNVGSVVQS